MRSETMQDVMLVLFTIAVIGVFLYAFIVEPIIERRADRRWQAANGLLPEQNAEEQASS